MKRLSPRESKLACPSAAERAVLHPAGAGSQPACGERSLRRGGRGAAAACAASAAVPFAPSRAGEALRAPSTRRGSGARASVAHGRRRNGLPCDRASGGARESMPGVPLSAAASAARALAAHAPATSGSLGRSVSHEVVACASRRSAGEARGNRGAGLRRRWGGKPAGARRLARTFAIAARAAGHRGALLGRRIARSTRRCSGDAVPGPFGAGRAAVASGRAAIAPACRVGSAFSRPGAGFGPIGRRNESVPRRRRAPCRVTLGGGGEVVAILVGCSARRSGYGGWPENPREAAGKRAPAAPRRRVLPAQGDRIEHDGSRRASAASVGRTGHGSVTAATPFLRKGPSIHPTGVGLERKR